jgi:DDE family transposase
LALPLAAVFDDLPDPRRQTTNKLHRLIDRFTIATCAVSGGAQTWEAIALFGRCQEAFYPLLFRVGAAS